MKWIVAIVLPVLMTFAGCAVGLAIHNSAGPYAGASWKLLDTLSDKPVKILAADVDFAFIQSVADKIYYCDAGTKQNPCKEATGTSVYTRFGPYVSGTPIPTLSARVIDSAEVQDRGHFLFETRYALTDDGKIWIWKYSSAQQSFGLETVIYGAIIGFVISIVILILIWKGL